MPDRFDQPFFTLPEVLTNWARWQPEKTAVINMDRSQTFLEFNKACNRIANGLKDRGLNKGDKVVVYMANSLEMLQTLWGVIKGGYVAVPMSTMVPAEVVSLMVRDCEARAIFVESPYDQLAGGIKYQLVNVNPDSFFALNFNAPGWQDYSAWFSAQSEAEPAVRIEPGDDMNIIYSSGTTGTPKGIVHTHYARNFMALNLGLGFRMHMYSRPIHTTPLYTNGTWMMMLPAIALGMTQIIMPHFDPRLFLELVQKEKATHTFMVPTQFIMIMATPGFEQYDVSSMEIMLAAAAPLRLETKKEITQKFKGVKLAELYGCTEGIGTIWNPEEMVGDKSASVGRPGAGTDIVILDDNNNILPRGQAGEIVGYGSSMMRGYYKRPDKTQEAMWIAPDGRTFLRTGDMGKLDEDGFLYILDRKKDMIVSGGVNVYASDIEEVIFRHPAVQDCTVVAIPDDKWGEQPLGLVVKKPGEKATEEEIKNWVNEKLAKYQRLARIEIRDTLPRNILGKVLKRELREPYWKDFK